MAVYTHISNEEAAAHLALYNIGELLSISGISAGTQNTNYLIKTTEGSFILTISEEKISGNDFDFFVSFMRHLKAKEVPCPDIVLTKTGEQSVKIKKKPSVITKFIEGAHPEKIELFHIKEVGKHLAKLHLASGDFKLRRDPSLFIPQWRGITENFGSVIENLETGLLATVKDELDYIEENIPRHLPRGTIHGDLYAENTFFKDKKLTGIIDFYISFTSAYIYDLMTAVNCWSFDKDGIWNKEYTLEFLKAYEAVRPLNEIEKKSLYLFGRISALNFFFFRVDKIINARCDALVELRDPMEFIHTLRTYKKEGWIFEES